ncbi:MAG: hypothetical protein WCD49_18400 [Candidatus Acidiferrales bacterium]
MTQPAQQHIALNSLLLKTLSSLCFAAFLALAPSPAFAQHGGGGGGGGSHGGGGGGGGSHASSGSSHTGSGGSHPTSASTGGSTSNPNGSGHWWNPFHSNSGGAEAKSGTNSGAKGTGDGTTRFAAANNVWQDPQATNTRATTNRYVASNRSAASSTVKPVRNTFANNPHATGLSQNIFRRRPIIYYPYYPFGFYPYGYGFGFGFGCDPLWGCPPGFGYGFGFGYGAGFGYGGGDLGYYSGGADYGGSDLNFNATTPSSSPDDVGSPEGNAGDWQDAPVDNSQSNNANAQPYAILILRDGSSYAVGDYWLAGGKLHYVTSYGGENSIDANQLDLQRTVNENALRGITFTLRPTPAANAPADEQNPQPAPTNIQPAPAPNPQ